MNDDDIDLPEFTEEILNEFKPVQNVDLHLGPAEVQKNPWIKDPNWFVKKYGPKPLGIEIRILDVLIVLLAQIW